MAELPLAAASRRLRLGRKPDERPFSELDVKPHYQTLAARESDEVDEFLEFSRCFSFRGSDARSLISPLVYVLMRGNRALYVGMSARGAARPFNPAHHALRHMRDTDKLLIWPVENAMRALAMEQELIKRLRPVLNKQGLTRDIAAALGQRRVRRAG